MFHKTTGHLEVVGIKTCSLGTRFLLCRDKMIRQHGSPLNPELTKISGSEKLRPTSPKISSVVINKPYSDMHNHSHFTNLEQEYSDFLYNLQTFTDPGHKPNPNVLERKAWTVQYNGPLSLVGQKVNPTQVLYENRLIQSRGCGKGHKTTNTLHR